MQGSTEIKIGLSFEGHILPVMLANALLFGTAVDGNNATQMANVLSDIYSVPDGAHLLDLVIQSESVGRSIGLVETKHIKLGTNMDAQSAIGLAMADFLSESGGLVGLEVDLTNRRNEETRKAWHKRQRDGQRMFHEAKPTGDTKQREPVADETADETPHNPASAESASISVLKLNIEDGSVERLAGDAELPPEVLSFLRSMSGKAKEGDAPSKH